MKSDPYNVLNAILKNDLSSFIQKVFQTVDGSQPYVQNFHIDVIADYLQRCASGEITRLIINLPPRSLKSICASVAFPAWLLGHDPTRRIINVSYSDGLSGKLARDCRAAIEADFYKGPFPDTKLNPKKRSESEFETTAGGYRIATSIGGVLTGRGGNIIIVDDSLKPQDALSDVMRNSCNAWYLNTLCSRLDNKETGCIIIVMQRLHVDDLCGFVQQGDDWTVLSLPAIATEFETYTLSNGKIYTRAPGEALNPKMESIEKLTKMKALIGDYNFSSQYQQQPIPVKGNVINFDWFRTYQNLPNLVGYARVIQSWDTAMTEHDGSDFSACVTILEHARQYYILDVYSARLSFPALLKKVAELQITYNAEVILVEEKASGISLRQMLEYEGIYTIGYKPEGSKADRALAQSAVIEAGRVCVPAHANWKDGFKTEIISFPYGRHDDQVDALSQALHWLNQTISSLDPRVLGID